MFPTVYKMTQNPGINKQLHVKSDKECDGYLDEWHKLGLIEKQQATKSQGHDHLHNIEGQIAVAELDWAGKVVAVVLDFGAL